MEGIFSEKNDASREFSLNRFRQAFHEFREIPVIDDPGHTGLYLVQFREKRLWVFKRKFRLLTRRLKNLSDKIGPIASFLIFADNIDDGGTEPCNLLAQLAKG